MIQLIVDNQNFSIRNADSKTIKRLDALTSYRVQGYFFSPAYQDRRWDGKEHLLTFRRTSIPPGYWCPIGLLSDVINALKAQGLEYSIDWSKRKRNHFPKPYKWNPDIELRSYQHEVIKSMTTGDLPGTGIIKMPPRSGKTYTAARLIYKLKSNAILLVPDRWLLHQSKASLEKCLGVPVGRIGDGIWDLQEVTVATIGTLLSRRGGSRIKTINGKKQHVTVPRDPEYNSLMKRFDLVITDECIEQGSFVQMADGTTKPIESICIGDLVATPIGPRRVSKVMDRGLRWIDRIYAGKQHLGVTSDHPMAYHNNAKSCWDVASKANKAPQYLYHAREDSFWNFITRLVPPSQGDIWSLSAARLGACRPVKVERYQNRVCRTHVWDLDVEEAHCFVANKFLVHNCHHLKGKEWHKVTQDFQAYFRVGLSATAFPDRDTEQEKGGIWLKACCGDVRVDIPISRLVEEGWLVRPLIELHCIKEPNLVDRPWEHSLSKDGIYCNEYRNLKISKIVRELALDRKLKVLIVSNRKEQVSLLAQLIESMGVAQAVITGETRSDERAQIVNMLLDGRVKVIIGTVFGEGVDIPEVEAVVNAEGGKDIKSTLQRMRNLTACEGKTKAVFVDFIDETNPYLAKHSLERLRVYRSEEAFEIKIMQPI